MMLLPTSASVSSVGVPSTSALLPISFLPSQLLTLSVLIISSAILDCSFTHSRSDLTISPFPISIMFESPVTR